MPWKAAIRREPLAIVFHRRKSSSKLQATLRRRFDRAAISAKHPMKAQLHPKRLAAMADRIPKTAHIFKC